MNYIAEFEKYSADKELVFKGKHDPACCTTCDLPNNGDVKQYISVYADYLQRVSVYIRMEVAPESKHITLISKSKAKPANLYKQILKQLEEKKVEINEKISWLQKSFNYKKEAIEDSKCFDDIPGIKKNDSETYGYYSAYGKLNSRNESKNATLEFSSDKKEIAKILKCLLDNGIITSK